MTRRGLFGWLLGIAVAPAAVKADPAVAFTEGLHRRIGAIDFGRNGPTVEYCFPCPPRRSDIDYEYVDSALAQHPQHTRR
jgi:hypothetical protein